MSETRPDPARLTLRDAFEVFCRGDVTNRQTLQSYRTSLSRWERLTGNPPVAEIDNRSLAEFRQACLNEGLAPATFNLTWRHLRTILRRLGPQQYRNPMGEGLIPRIPYVRLLREEREFPRIPTLEELGAVYAVCEKADWPRLRYGSPADWWRALLVTAYNTAARTSDLLDRPWSDVDFGERLIRFRARKTRKKQTIPLNEVTLAHLRAIFSPQREFVFDANTSQVKKGLSRQLHELQDFAGIAEHFTLKTLRKSCASALVHTGYGDVAGYITGHAVSRDEMLPAVTEEYYVNPLGRIRQAIDSLPQPEAFLAVFDRRDLFPVRRADWQFRPGEATYRGHSFGLPRRLLRLLQAFISAGGELSFDDVRAAVFWDEPLIARTTIKTTVNQLRNRLQGELKLPVHYNPLPKSAAGDGWVLQVP